MRNARKSERGASLAETAIVMAVVLALVFAIMDFGRAMYTYAFVAQLAREGARWAIVRGVQCTQLDHCNAAQTDIQAYVQTLSEGATNPNSITASATWPACPAGLSGKQPGCVVSVTVTYPFEFLAIKFIPGMQNPLMTMSSTSQMVISQ
jgi:Flp pilus assembly protein TadG